MRERRVARPRPHSRKVIIATVFAAIVIVLIVFAVNRTRI